VQLLEQLGHFRGIAPLCKLLSDGFDVVIALGLGQG
jgi:hypothetical protein